MTQIPADLYFAGVSSQSTKTVVPIRFARDLARLREEPDLRSSRYLGEFMARYRPFYESWAGYWLNRFRNTGHELEDLTQIAWAATVTAVESWQPGTVSGSRLSKYNGKVVTLERYVKWQVGNAMSRACRQALRWPSTFRRPHECGDPGCDECDARIEEHQQRVGGRVPRRLVPVTAFEDVSVHPNGASARHRGVTTMLVGSTDDLLAGAAWGRPAFSAQPWSPRVVDDVEHAVTDDDPLPSEFRQHVVRTVFDGGTICDAVASWDDSDCLKIKTVAGGYQMVRKWTERIGQKNAEEESTVDSVPDLMVALNRNQIAVEGRDPRVMSQVLQEHYDQRLQELGSLSTGGVGGGDLIEIGKASVSATTCAECGRTAVEDVALEACPFCGHAYASRDGLIRQKVAGVVARHALVTLGREMVRRSTESLWDLAVFLRTVRENDAWKIPHGDGDDPPYRTWYGYLATIGVSPKSATRLMRIAQEHTFSDFAQFGYTKLLVVSQQPEDSERRRRADAVMRSGGSKREMERAVKQKTVKSEEPVTETAPTRGVVGRLEMDVVQDLDVRRAVSSEQALVLQDVSVSDLDGTYVEFEITDDTFVQVLFQVVDGRVRVSRMFREAVTR